LPAGRDATGLTPAKSATGLSVEWLGRLPYLEALECQAQAVEARRQAGAGDRLLLLEHPPVITLGRGAKEENLLVSLESLNQRGIELYRVSRGGDITYHAPGQLVGYLISDLRAGGELDLHEFLRRMEASLIDALGELGLKSHRVAGMTGVYLDPEAHRPRRKLASIGVGVKHWISFHGFALNVDVDLSGFEAIVPCGLSDVEMTSIANELGEADLGVAREAVGRAFGARFS
jgi:lipoyl(octanoyl) transferase